MCGLHGQILLLDNHTLYGLLCRVLVVCCAMVSCQPLTWVLLSSIP